MVVLSVKQKGENLEEQQNEKEILLSMFDKAVTVQENVMTITIKSKYFLLVLRCLYYDHYPSHEAPIFTIINMTNSRDCPLDIAQLEKECGKCFSAGECVIYQWVVYLQEYLEILDHVVDENSPDVPEDDPGEIVTNFENLEIEENFSLDDLQSNSKFDYVNTYSSDIDQALLYKITIFTGEILTERKSHFQAHVCKVKNRPDIDHALATLLQNPKIAAATHNIYAYRYTNQSGTIASDYDDDGEAKAGGRLMELLDLMKVEDLLVVVSRWYGGVQLGPARFKCINNIAKVTIVGSGLYESQTEQGKKKKKKK